MATKMMEEMEGRIESLVKEIRKEKDNLQNGFFSAEVSETLKKEVLKSKMPSQVRILKGHFGPVYALHWAGEKNEALICTVSQDAKLIVWNAMTQMKSAAISDANWAMTCAFEQKECNTVAFGGLDNYCYVYHIRDDIGPSKPAAILRDFHQGYLSCCRFIDNGRSMITASGDGRCALWDIETGVTKKVFSGHKADVMRLSVSPTNEAVFVTASVDATCKLWDIRENKKVLTFEGHDSDVNCVEFFPDGLAFASGSDDESCKLFDTRSYQCINTYRSDSVVSPCTSVAFSHSGRVLFAAYENETCPIAWDVLKESDSMIGRLEGGRHARKVVCLGVSAKGHALASGSWDQTVKIWA